MITSVDITPISEHVPTTPSMPQVMHNITNMLPATIQKEPDLDRCLHAAIRKSSSPDASDHHVSSPSGGLKHPCNLAYPDDSKVHKRTKLTPQAGQPGLSKQAVSKRRVLDQIRDGTFVQNPKRWDVFKSKLSKLDPRFEVSETDPTLARSVKHLRCRAWIQMAAPYDTERFKGHVKRCSYSTAAGGMITLDKFILKPKSAQLSTSPNSSDSSSSPSRVALPCPGLTKKDDPRIAQYVKRTSVNSAGGSDIHDVAMDLFSKLFKNLTSDEKDIVRQKQIQTHSWSVDRMRKSVHAIGKSPCAGNAQQAKDGTLIACIQCLALLSLHAFRNAISREPPKDENRVYVPHKFQPAEVGKLYGMGFNSLIDGVRYMHTFSLILKATNLISNLLDIFIWRDLDAVCASSGSRKSRP